MSTSLSGLALQELHNYIIEQLRSMDSKYAFVSILNKYNDELVKRNEVSLSQSIYRLISNIHSSNVDNIWVIDKIQGFLKQEYSKTTFQRQQDFVVDTKNWSKMSNWLVIDNLINQFKTNMEVDMVIYGLTELRHHLSPTLNSKQTRDLSSLLNEVKATKNFDLNHLIRVLRHIQNEYR